MIRLLYAFKQEIFPLNSCMVLSSVPRERSEGNPIRGLETLGEAHLTNRIIEGQSSSVPGGASPPFTGLNRL